MFPPNKFLKATLCGLCILSPYPCRSPQSWRVSGYQVPPCLPRVTPPLPPPPPFPLPPLPPLPPPPPLLPLQDDHHLGSRPVSSNCIPAPISPPSLGSHSPDPSEQDQTGFRSCSPRSGAGTAGEILLESRLPPVRDFFSLWTDLSPSHSSEPLVLCLLPSLGLP